MQFDLKLQLPIYTLVGEVGDRSIFETLETETLFEPLEYLFSELT